jgi:hypothetical protein
MPSPQDHTTRRKGPTREQLLTAVDRVRALHHDWENDPGHCAHCTGADGNLVPYPCPTVQALDGGIPA